MVLVGDKLVDYNPEFRLFLATRNPSPQLPPDVASVITEVNFTTTRAGLEGQLLGVAIKHEKPELEERQSQLLEQVNFSSIYCSVILLFQIQLVHNQMYVVQRS